MPKKTLVNRLSAAEGKYLEAIDILVKKHDKASVSNIALALHVAPSSVTEMITKLSNDGFVWHKPYCSVMLTPKGQDLVDFFKQRQLALRRFFELLEIDAHIAKVDACKIQHVLHGVTLERLSQYVKFVETTYYSDNCVNCFRTYLKNKKTR
jgi:DtxR family Mn-dependent transcriptional regulator